ncbi:MAG: ATP-grasp domain-containing protein [Gemmatimonadota bacterium]
MSLPVPDPPPVVWLGAAGTGTAFGIAASIRARWGGAVRLIAADTNPAHLVAASALADAFVQVPPAASPEFAAFLTHHLVQARATTYVPILDREILVAAELAEAGRLPAGLALIAPAAATARICLDKLATAAWLTQQGLPSPRTQLARDASWDDADIVAKPRHGVGSVGFRRITSRDELAALGGSEDLVVQELCCAPEITLDVFRSRRTGFVRAVCRERLEVKAGVCTKARIFESDELADLARRVAEGLALTGTFCMQVMRATTDGSWRITDINPRPGAGTRMTVAAGVDILCAGLADAWGMDVEPLLHSLPRERFVVRQYAEYAF